MSATSFNLPRNANYLPKELREFSYVFSGFNRVLTFQGRIKENLDLDSIMVGWTKPLRGRFKANIPHPAQYLQMSSG